METPPNISRDSSTHPTDDRLQRVELFRLQLARFGRVLRRFWWVLAITIGMGLAYQSWSAFTKPPTYKSSARILVSGRITLPEGGVFSEEAANFYGTQIELMGGKLVRHRALDRVQRLRPDLAPVPVDLSVAQMPRASIFALQASGPQPEYVQAFLNAVIEEYITLRRSILADKSQSALVDISDQLARVEGELQDTEQQVIDWKSENNLDFLQESSEAAGAQLKRLNAELAVLESEFSLMGRLTEEQNFGRTASDAPPLPESDSQPIQQVDTGPILSGRALGAAQAYLSARQQLSLLEHKRDELAKLRKPDHPAVRQVDQEIQTTQRLIETLRDRARQEMESHRQTLAAQLANTKEQLQKWEQRAIEIGRRMGEFERMQEKLSRVKALYDRLLESIQRVDVNSNIQQDILTVMEYATPPVANLRPLARELILGALAGLAVGIVILLLIAAFDDRVVSLLEIQSSLNQIVVGIIPRVPSGQQLLGLPRGDSPEVPEDNPGLLESTRKVRSWLLLSRWENGPPKSIMIASAVPGEGKSTTAFNLAACLSGTGKSVLIVDADLKRGTLHRILDIPQDPGLGNILNGECDLGGAISSTRIPNLSAIPRGTYKTRGAEVFLGASLEHFLAGIEKQFDFVIFDTPPCLATDESSALASRVDVTLLIVRAAFTSLRIARRALDHLVNRGASVEGVIYNGVNPSSNEYPHYHYYYYEDSRNEKPRK